MIDLILIPIAAICNRFRGGGIYRFAWEKRLDELEAQVKVTLDNNPFARITPEHEKLKTRSKRLARKLLSGVVLAVTTGLLYNFTKLDSSYIQTASVAGIVLMGWYARNIIGTGYLFNTIHGWYAPKWKGVAYGAARGLLTLATTIPLAILFYFTGQSPNINSCILLSLLGLFGALQGGIYWLGGRVSKSYAVTVAEYLDGALYGGIICALPNWQI